MLQVNRILFPTDFSPTSDAALVPACNWARRLGAEIHILHVIESLRPDLYAASLVMPDPALVDATLAEKAGHELEERCRQARDRGARVTSASIEGLSAAPAILDYAEAHDFDLVAMSTHGRRGLRRFLLGSVTEEVVQRSATPVLTLRGENTVFDAVPHRILAAVDLSEHSVAAIQHAKELAAMVRGELQLLHVLVRPPVPVYYDGMAAPNLLSDLPQLIRDAETALEKLYHSAGGSDGPVSLHVVQGLAVEEILRFARVNSSDVVVVASHGLTGVSHLLLGSVAESVVRQSSCPVLTLKSFGKSLLLKGAVVSRASAAG